MAEDWVDIQADAAHVSRERKKARELKSSEWWKSVLQKGLCHYCGKHFPPDVLTMDHLIPVSRGGFSKRGNVVPACLDCNQKKKYLTPAEQALAALESSGKLDPLDPDDFFP